ncbi:hypothetical protein [Mesorhizobium sp. DCY119]|uniref:5'-methylthioadenosine/S-adenosylhomocysteine nucleosidase family protein n=1 Tax=Mesorhizobium sp. DCY119 TaxID=2108445 RepID=UPI0010589850|nr:hypothetical protein [Mesorhizobium sp. DCY119]
MTARNIFLHFANRELNKSTSQTINSRRHNELFRIAATLSSGYLCAPFSQVHEQYNNIPAIQRLVSTLCAENKLLLHNEARDAYQFKSSRVALYGAVKEKYSFYFSGSPLTHEQDYRRLPGLSPTNKIKSVLSDAVVGRGSSNLLSSVEVERIRRQGEFIRKTLDSTDIAATFSVYQEHPIEPKPAEVIFLGEISSRIYVRHHAEYSDSVVMTGVYNDPFLEDMDHYPLFDIAVHGQLMDTLGAGALINNHEDALLLCSLIGDRHFVDFCDAREAFVDAIHKSLLRSSRCDAYPSHSITTLIKKVGASFGSQISRIDLGNAAAMYSGIARLAELAKEKIQYFSEEYERGESLERSLREKVVIHIATDLEEEVVRELIPARGWTYLETRSSGKVSYNRYISSGNPELLLVRSSAGTSTSNGSLVTMQSILSNITPIKVISVGICFGYDPSKQKAGDIVVSERVAHYESSRINLDGTTTYRGDKIPACSEVVSRARSLRVVPRDCTIHVGPTVSGDKLIDNPEFRDSLLDFEDKAIAGDMEAAGLAVVCVQAGVGFSMIKGIADFGEKKDKKSQRRAAENAISFALEIVAAGFK